MAEWETPDADEALNWKKRPGVVAFGIFLYFGAAMAALAATTLIWQDTILKGVWKLNPTAYKQLAPLGRAVGTLFFLLSGLMAVAGFGWFQRRHWGWSLAVGVISAQVLGDLINLHRGRFLTVWSSLFARDYALM